MLVTWVRYVHKSYPMEPLEFVVDKAAVEQVSCHYLGSYLPMYQLSGFCHCFIDQVLS
jgi:hypothetical protein